MAGHFTTRRRLAIPRALLAALFALLLLGATATTASASHFRSGNLSWESAGSPGAVTFQNTQAWRRSAFFGSGSDGSPVVGDVIDNSEGCIDTGDTATTGDPVVCPSYLVTESHPNEDWIVVRAIASPTATNDFNVPYTYAATTGTFTAITSSCCTISDLSNAPDSSWNVTTLVNLGGDTGSPHATVAPIITFPSQSGVKTFQIPHTYSGSGVVTYRLADANESCAGCTDPQPPSFTVDPTTGQASFNTSNAGLWWAGVVLEARDSSTNALLSSSQVQLIIRVGGPPQWTGLTPADGANFTVFPNDTVSFDLESTDPDAADQVHITQDSGPGLLTPVDGNPATAHFSYTPTDADVGQTYTVSFGASEISSIPRFADPRTYTISVVGRPLPPPPPPPPGGNGELPPPVQGVAANATPEKGEVFVKLPAGAANNAKFRWARKASAHAAAAPKGFIPLAQARQIPMGSILETKKGQVGLTLASGLAGATQTGHFSQGRFKLRQSRKNPLTTLSMSGALKCKGVKVPKGGVKKIATEARRRSRRLFSNAHGRFRTRGRNSSATVRGTKWLQKDSCSGTTTSVKSGKVVVRDFTKRKNVVVKKGKKYTARPPKKHRR